MRIFEAIQVVDGLALKPKRLENTPDIARIGADSRLRQALVDYVKANLSAIDEGVFQLPDELLATSALSFSTFGSARLANHPFSALLNEQDFAGLDYAGLGLIRSLQGLAERLDNASCMGCHQSGGTAGFHFFGLDTPPGGPLGDAYNIVLQGISPHYHAEHPRRAAYLAALAEGRTPNRFRPLSAAPPADWTGPAPRYAPAGTAMACIAERSHFAQNWSCGARQSCQVIGANRRLGVAVGQCLPEKKDEVFSGLACLSGAIETGRAPYLDRYRTTVQLSAFARKATPTAYNCRPPRIGVPGGLVYRQCAATDKAFAGIGRTMPAQICGLAGGKSFDDCVATNDFATCYKASVVRGMRAACGRDRFCREDYMCQAIPRDIAGTAGLDPEMGFCSPTYFLFQMRLDGHPDPLRGAP